MEHKYISRRKIKASKTLISAYQVFPNGPESIKPLQKVREDNLSYVSAA